MILERILNISSLPFPYCFTKQCTSWQKRNHRMRRMSTRSWGLIPTSFTGLRVGYSLPRGLDNRFIPSPEEAQNEAFPLRVPLAHRRTHKTFRVQYLLLTRSNTHIESLRWLLTLRAHLNFTVTWTFMKPIECRWFLHWKHVKTCVFYVVLYMKTCVQQPNYFYLCITSLLLAQAPALYWALQCFFCPHLSSKTKGDHFHPEGIYCMVSICAVTEETWASIILSSLAIEFDWINSCCCAWSIHLKSPKDVQEGVVALVQLQTFLYLSTGLSPDELTVPSLLKKSMKLGTIIFVNIL